MREGTERALFRDMELLFTAPSGALAVAPLVSGAYVRDLKAFVAKSQGVSVEAVAVNVNGLAADDNEQIEETNDLSVYLPLVGAGKGGKKKKQYTTPKHVPHKRKKVKLPILSHYSIEEGNLVRLSKPCANKTCGPGVFMAKHTKSLPERLTCGKCYLTLLKKD